MTHGNQLSSVISNHESSHNVGNPVNSQKNFAFIKALSSTVCQSSIGFSNS
ncbi:MAG: hypothetical protein Q8S84_00515 [bacterium]|nr:hypothetical protein [bacterium]MDP3380071.1 hypothetical protein [bacterium]